MSASIRWGVPPQGSIPNPGIRSLLAFWLGGGSSPQGASLAAGSAIGDATAAAISSSLADIIASAIGDASADAALDASANFAGSAIGDALAQGASVDVSTATAAPQSLLAFWMGGGSGTVAGTIQSANGLAVGDSTASGTLAALADFDGSATGDAIANSDSSIGQALGAPQGLLAFWLGGGFASSSAVGAGFAAGDSTASGGLDAIADMAGTAIGDASCDGIAANAGSFVAPVISANFGAGGPAWRSHYKSTLPKKKRKIVDELDEMIAELRSRIEEVPSDDQDIYQRRLRVSEALANRPNVSFREIQNQVVLLRIAIQDIDDEEAILLLAA